MTGEVVAFRPVERVRQDSEPIALMYRSMGTATAEQVVGRALGELSILMSGLSQQVARNDPRDFDCPAAARSDLARQLRRLQRMAEQLGLVSIGQVAGDIRDCLASGDGTAFAAVWARLIRVAERSLLPQAGFLDQKP